jgi:dephospho-CoA kinase
VRTIGLTGSIATGKSTVADYLAHAHSLYIVDADELAREAVLPRADGLIALADRYGPGILLADGTLDRPQLAQLIFQDAAERIWVEGLIHPFVRRRLEAERDRIQSCASTVVMVIPLLFEARMTDLVSEIWVVSCTAEQQLSRLMSRSGLTRGEAQARIESQMPLMQKCALADVVLDNSTSLESLHDQTDRALRLKTRPDCRLEC